MNNWEWEPWLYEFKKQYGGQPILSYRTLRYLLDRWHNGWTPKNAAQAVKEMMEMKCE